MSSTSGEGRVKPGGGPRGALLGMLSLAPIGAGCWGSWVGGRRAKPGGGPRGALLRPLQVSALGTGCWGGGVGSVSDTGVGVTCSTVTLLSSVAR